MAANSEAVEEVDEQSGSEPISVMRQFLENYDTFTWPLVEGQKPGSYFEFVDSSPYPRPEIIMRDEGPLGVPEYYAKDLKAQCQAVKKYSIIESKQAEMKFCHSFAVKRLTRESGRQKDNIKEARAMTGLRHPHVAALLGTYFYYQIDHIIMFPAGRMDLADFLWCVSKRIKSESLSDGQVIGGIASDRLITSRCRPFTPTESLDQLLKRLQGYFLCLCQGLSYLHASNVRHKDIKPENIVIDQSGNIVFVDFGTAVRFNSGHTTATQNPDAMVTDEYATPERMRREPRDKRSDVWCLGCVFVKMLTLLFGKTLDDLHDSIGHPIPKTKLKVTLFHKELNKVYAWLETLKHSSFSGSHYEDLVRASTDTVRQMLADKMEHRIDATDLWEKFDFAPAHCRDCHPARSPWRPTRNQELAFDQGREARTEIAADDKVKEKLIAQLAMLRPDLSVPVPSLHTSLVPSNATGRKHMSLVLNLPGQPAFRRQGSPSWHGRARSHESNILLNDTPLMARASSPTLTGSTQRPLSEADPENGFVSPTAPKLETGPGKDLDHVAADEIKKIKTNGSSCTSVSSPPPAGQWHPRDASIRTPPPTNRPVSPSAVFVSPSLHEHDLHLNEKSPNPIINTSSPPQSIARSPPKPSRAPPRDATISPGLDLGTPSLMPSHPPVTLEVLKKSDPDTTISVLNLTKGSKSGPKIMSCRLEVWLGMFDHSLFFELEKDVHRYSVHGDGTVLTNFDIHSGFWSRCIPSRFKAVPKYVCIINWGTIKPGYIRPDT